MKPIIRIGRRLYLIFIFPRKLIAQFFPIIVGHRDVLYSMRSTHGIITFKIKWTKVNGIVSVEILYMKGKSHKALLHFITAFYIQFYRGIIEIGFFKYQQAVAFDFVKAY